MVFDISQQATVDSDRRALEEFVVNNPELEQLDPKKDIGISKNKKTPFGQEVSVI